MTPYRTNEAQIYLPDGWRDQSVTLFSSSLTDPSDASFVMTRERRPVDVALNTYVDQQIALLQRSLSKFTLVRSVATYAGGADAIEVEYTWVTDNRLMRQLSVCLFHRQQVLTLTGTAQDRLFDQYRDTLQLLLYSITLEP